MILIGHFHTYIGFTRTIAEYALKDINKPIGVSEYELTQAIPENLKGKLPSIEEIETELNQFSRP